MTLVTSEDRRLYLTVRDPQTRKSKTITVRGQGLTAKRFVKFITAQLREHYAKAG